MMQAEDTSPLASPSRIWPSQQTGPSPSHFNIPELKKNKKKTCLLTLVDSLRIKFCATSFIYSCPIEHVEADFAIRTLLVSIEFRQQKII